MRFKHSRPSKHSESALQKSRLYILMAMVLCFSILLIARLAYLQIAQYKRFDTLSLNNQMSVIPIAPTRGIIVDRQGVILAENVPVYVLEIIPEHVKKLNQTLHKLQILIPSISTEDIELFHRLRRQNRTFVPIPLKLKLTQEEVATFASNQYQFTGVSIKARLIRHYPLGEITAHVLGYVGRINIPELQKLDTTNYRGTDFVGKAGIEKYYEDLLHGQVGYQQVETNVSGRTIRILNKINPISGEELTLTLDIRLQKAAFEALKEKRGAVVAINPKNGAILALVSTPAFDPNIFVNGINSKDYNVLATSKERPLYNRAVRGLYPPASTIKPFMAITGLEKSVVDVNSRVYDPGWFKLPNSQHAYRDWKKTGHGTVNLTRAITVSCDIYFFHLSQKLGIQNIYDELSQFGFGQLTQVDMQEEAAGILPNAQWKRQKKGVSWYPGDTVITSIGQGFMLSTPLQLASATASLSQKGKRFRPHLLEKRQLQSIIYSYQPKACPSILLHDDNYWNIVHEAMHAVITKNEGTGYRFGRNAPYSVAAKTGTAQVFGGKNYDQRRLGRPEDIPEFLRDNSLFIGFAPVENPEIAIAVIVENDALASNVARKVMDAYFLMQKEGDPL